MAKPQRRTALVRQPRRVRQWIESVYNTLKGQLDLERHGGRATEAVYARVAHRLAMAAAIWHDWTIKTTGLRP